MPLVFLWPFGTLSYVDKVLIHGLYRNKKVEYRGAERIPNIYGGIGRRPLINHWCKGLR